MSFASCNSPPVGTRVGHCQLSAHCRTGASSSHIRHGDARRLVRLHLIDFEFLLTLPDQVQFRVQRSRLPRRDAVCDERRESTPCGVGRVGHHAPRACSAPWAWVQERLERGGAECDANCCQLRQVYVHSTHVVC